MCLDEIFCYVFCHFFGFFRFFLGGVCFWVVFLSFLSGLFFLFWFFVFCAKCVWFLFFVYKVVQSYIYMKKYILHIYTNYTKLYNLHKVIDPPWGGWLIILLHFFLFAAGPAGRL